jgi:hypothetical protein
LQSLTVRSLSGLYDWRQQSTTDGRLLHRFWNIFTPEKRPQTGQSREDWKADLEFEFTLQTDSGDVRTVRILAGLQDGFRWSVGRGVWLMDSQWPLRDSLNQLVRARDDQDPGSSDEASAKAETLREQMFNEHAWQRVRESLVTDHEGRWVAIVDGRVLASFANFAECVTAADQANPFAGHRYIFRPGFDDQPGEFAHSPWVTGQPNWWQLGIRFHQDQGLTVSTDRWTANGRTLSTDARGRGAIVLTTPGKPDKAPRLSRLAVCSGLLQQPLTMIEEDVQHLGLQRFAVPGTARSLTYAVDCQRVHVHVDIDGLSVARTVIGIVLPSTVVSRDPPSSGNDGPDIFIEDHSRAAAGTSPGNSNRDPWQRSGHADGLNQTASREWTVQGTVTDEDGRPLDGVRIHAAAGMGSLQRTGETVTDASGRYALEFGPGFRRLGDNGDPVGVQAAIIFASLDGYSEVNLCRQGDRLMAASMPETDTAWGSVDQIRDKLILPDQQVRIDFVMRPAATLRGFLSDAQGNPLQRRLLSLSGPELPPASSVYEQTHTDLDGGFELAGIPLDRTWHIEFRIPGSRRELATPAFTLRQPGNSLWKLTADLAASPPQLRYQPLTDEQARDLARRQAARASREPLCGSQPPQGERPPLQWGPENAGLQAALTSLQGWAVKPGELIDLQLLIRNTGQQPIAFESESWRQEDRLQILSVAPRPGKQKLQQQWQDKRAVFRNYVLEPGEEIAIPCGALQFLEAEDAPRDPEATWLASLPPGKYLASLSARIPSHRAEVSGWQGQLRSGEVQFEVLTD